MSSDVTLEAIQRELREARVWVAEFNSLEAEYVELQTKMLSWRDRAVTAENALVDIRHDDEVIGEFPHLAHLIDGALNRTLASNRDSEQAD